MSYRSSRARNGSVGSAAAHRNCGVLLPVPCTGRGGTASTSGRGHFALAPARTLRLTRRGVQNDAAAVQQGGLGVSDLLEKELADVPMTPRRLMHRRIKSCRSPSQLVALVLEEVTNFDNQNAAHALSRFAKMYMGRAEQLSPNNVREDLERRQLLAELRPAIDSLTKRMHQLIGTYDSWDATQSLWAYARLGYHDEMALRALCDAALDVAPIFKPADCANTLVAFAYLDFLHAELLRQVVSTMLDTLDDFQPGEVAQVLWGFAKLGCHPGEPFLTEVVDAVHWRMQQYSTQELVMVLWSLVRLQHKPGARFLRDAETTLLVRLPHLVPVDLCQAVWALSRLRYKAVRLLDEAPQAIGPQLRSCSNAELCALVSAFATSHHYHRVLLDAVAMVLLGRLPSLTNQEVCVALWTYGTFHHRPSVPEFGKQLAAALLNRMARFSPQGLAMTAKALAQLQWRSESVLGELVAASEAQLQAFKPLEMSQLLWGLSALHCKDLSIYYAVVRRCINILKNPRHPHYRTMMHHRVVNSVILSCQQLGYVPWTLIDFAESKGIRVKQPDILSSRDEDDEGMLPSPAGLSSPFSAEDEDVEAQARAGTHGSSGSSAMRHGSSGPRAAQHPGVLVLGDNDDEATWERPRLGHNGGHDDATLSESIDVGEEAAGDFTVSLGRSFLGDLSPGQSVDLQQQQQAQPRRRPEELLMLQRLQGQHLRSYYTAQAEAEAAAAAAGAEAEVEAGAEAEPLYGSGRGLEPGFGGDSPVEGTAAEALGQGVPGPEGSGPPSLPAGRMLMPRSGRIRRPSSGPAPAASSSPQGSSTPPPPAPAHSRESGRQQQLMPRQQQEHKQHLRGQEPLLGEGMMVNGAADVPACQEQQHEAVPVPLPLQERGGGPGSNHGSGDGNGGGPARTSPRLVVLKRRPHNPDPALRPLPAPATRRVR